MRITVLQAPVMQQQPKHVEASMQEERAFVDAQRCLARVRYAHNVCMPLLLIFPLIFVAPTWYHASLLPSL